MTSSEEPSVPSSGNNKEERTISYFPDHNLVTVANFVLYTHRPSKNRASVCTLKDIVAPTAKASPRNYELVQNVSLDAYRKILREDMGYSDGDRIFVEYSTKRPPNTRVYVNCDRQLRSVLIKALNNNGSRHLMFEIVSHAECKSQLRLDRSLE